MGLREQKETSQGRAELQVEDSKFQPEIGEYASKQEDASWMVLSRLWGGVSCCFCQCNAYAWIQHRVCVQVCILMSIIVNRYNYNINQRSISFFSKEPGSKYLWHYRPLRFLLGLLTSAIVKRKQPETIHKRTGIFIYRKWHGPDIKGKVIKVLRSAIGNQRRGRWLLEVRSELGLERQGHFRSEITVAEMNAGGNHTDHSPEAGKSRAHRGGSYSSSVAGHMWGIVTFLSSDILRAYEVAGMC